MTDSSSDKNEQETSLEFEPPILPWWVRVPVGILLLPISLLCLVGSFAFLLMPSSPHPWAQFFLGIIMIGLSIWLNIKLIRLIFGIQKRKKMMSPLALRACGLFFLLMPVGGLFTGHYIKNGYAGIAQGLLYLVIGRYLFRLAKQRGSVPTEKINESNNNNYSS